MAGNQAQNGGGEGWVLVALIVVLSSLFIAMAGVSLMLGQGRRIISLRQNDAEAIYVAQAGVMYGLYSFREGAGLTLRKYDIDDLGDLFPDANDDVFILEGKTAGFLLVNMIPAVVDRGRLLGQRDRVHRWRVRNVLAGSPIVQITHMTVSWASPQPSEGVVRIELNGSRVWPRSGNISPPMRSGTELNIVDMIVPPNNSGWVANTIWFSTNNVMQTKSFIDVAFRMADHVASGDPLDASIRVARYTPTLASRSANLTLTSSAEVRKGAFPFTAWRSLQAEYRVCADVVASDACNAEEEERTKEGRLLFYRELAKRVP